MTVLTVTNLPAATHGETVRCLFAIELSRMSWVIAFNTPLSERARAERCRGRERSHPPWSPRPRNAHEGFWNGLNPAGYKLVRRVPHARKGLALDRNETIAQRNAGVLE